MRLRIQKGAVLIMAISMAGSVLSSGQGTTLDFVYGGIDDAELILHSYLEPYANILGADLNAGWYNTARPHQLGGVDITISASMARAPSSMLSYDVSALTGLKGQLSPGSPSMAPTIAGSMSDRPELSYTQMVDVGGTMQKIEYARFTLPNGTGYDFVPLPMIQLSVGLPLGTDVSVRFLPVFKVRDYGEIGLWGVGGRHSISQWIPGIKSLGFLDIAVQGGYTKVSSSANIDMEPIPEFSVVEPNEEYDWKDQYMNLDVGGWTANLIASQTFSFLTIYEGIGYASSLVEMNLRGHFPVHYVILESDNPDDIGKPTYTGIENPVSLEIENINNLRYNIGARIKLGGFTLHYDFTYTLYATHSAGIGVSFR